MDHHLLLRNRTVARVVVGVPEGHQHIRARIETAAGDVLTLPEATLAAITRAYLGVSTHPSRHAVELRAASVVGKDGFAPVQLLETEADESALRAELAAPPPAPAAPEPEHDEPPTVPASVERGPIDPNQTHAGPIEDDADLELDDPEDDDGPVFGDVPTQHSRPLDV